MTKCFRILFALYLSFIGTTAVAFPENNPVPGGTVIIPLSNDNEQQPTAFFNKQPLAVIRHSGQWHAIVGLGLSIKPGQYFINANINQHKIKKSFVVADKVYESQYLTVKNKRKVNPTAEDMKRINSETIIKTRAKKTWTNQPVNADFIWPVDGRISSIFGLRRFFNNQPRRPHSGLDIAAAEGTPVKAIADARVIVTGNFFFSGNMIYLDHGQGLISLYAHMHRVFVEPGQLVHQGDIIGEVGQTGRVTGPHLHMSILLNQSAIDPKYWLPVKN